MTYDRCMLGDGAKGRDQEDAITLGNDDRKGSRSGSVVGGCSSSLAGISSR